MVRYGRPGEPTCDRLPAHRLQLTHDVPVAPDRQVFTTAEVLAFDKEVSKG